MQVLEALIKARTLLVQHGWTQNGWARDADGETRPWEDPRAECYCAAGALRRAIYGTDCAVPLTDPVLEQAESALRCQIVRLGYGAILIEEFNDQPHRTAEDVLAVFDAAIARAR